MNALAPCLLLTLMLVCTPLSIASTRLIFGGPGGSGSAAIISPLDKTEPIWNIDSYVSSLEEAGYSVETILNEAASLSFFKTELANYNLIILHVDSFYYEGFSYFCAGDNFDAFDPSQRIQYKEQYAAEITAHKISLEGPCIGFSMRYILDNYNTHSFNGLVIAYGSHAYELENAFLRNGVDAFITFYQDEPALGWGRSDSVVQTVVQLLAEHNSVRDSVAQFYLIAMRGHGQTADWPSIDWAGDGDYTI